MVFTFFFVIFGAENKKVMTNTEIIDRIQQLKKRKECRYSGSLLYSSGSTGYC